MADGIDPNPGANTGRNADPDGRGRARDIERFNRWAPTYDGSPFQRIFFGPIHSRIVEITTSAFVERSPGRSPGCIVDVGAGTGRLIRALQSHWRDARFIGVDPAANMVAEAARLNPDANFVQAPAEAIPLASASCDIVLSSISFHHWGEQAEGIREIARLLRPGGMFCLTDHTFIPARISGERVRTRAQIREMMISAGLLVLEQRLVRYPFIVATIAVKEGS